MKLPCTGSRHSIGLDIGARRIKAVQLDRCSSQWRISACASLSRHVSKPVLEQDEANWLKGMLDEHGFKGEQVALAVPDKALRMNVLELPPRKSGAPLESLARSEMARMHKMGPECFEMVFWDLPTPARASNSTFVLVAACAHCDADDLLDVVERAGFDVVALDVPFLAAARACRPLLKDVQDSAAILDIGWSAARLILLHDDVVVYVNSLTKSGLGGLVQSLAQEMRIDREQAEGLIQGRSREGFSGPARNDTDDERHAGDSSGGDDVYRRIVTTYAQGLAREMNTPVSYMVSQYPQTRLERLLLTGGGARMPGLGELLCGNLGLEVRRVLPKEMLNADGNVPDDSGGDMVSAIGLAEHENV